MVRNTVKEVSGDGRFSLGLGRDFHIVQHDHVLTKLEGDSWCMIENIHCKQIDRSVDAYCVD